MLVKAIVLALVAGLIFFLYSQGIFDAFSSLEAVQETINGYGIWGSVVYILAFALLEPFGLPGAVLIVAAAMIWPWQLAFLYSWIATWGASVVGYVFSRYIGRDFVEKRLPDNLKKYNQKLEQQALKTVITIRLLLFLLPAAHWFFGVSSVRFMPYFVGSVIGFLPGVLIFSFFGREILDYIESWDGPNPYVISAIVLFIVARRTWIYFDRKKFREKNAD